MAFDFLWLRTQVKPSSISLFDLTFCSHYIILTSHLYPIPSVRLMAFQDRDAHSEPLFQQFNILNFDDLYRLEVAKFMHDISHNKLQQTFQSIFSLVKERHSRVTRQTTDNKFSLPLVQTNYGKRFITFFGVKTWNNIPKDIRSLDSKHTFNTKYFAHLHSQYKKV